jgi:hypothetical protein
VLRVLVHGDHHELGVVPADLLYHGDEVVLAGDHAVPRRFDQPDGGRERFRAIIGDEDGQRLLR